MLRKAGANTWNLKATGTLGSLHRIQVDAARAASKLCRGHNVALAMPAPWHASSNIDPAFRLRLVDHGIGPKESGRLTQTWRRRRQLSKEQRDSWSSRSRDELLHDAAATEVLTSSPFTHDGTAVDLRAVAPKTAVAGWIDQSTALQTDSSAK